jgi:hypothetical protein
MAVWRRLAGEGALVISPLLACVQLTNALALAIPLTALGLIAVRDVGLGSRPEELIAYDSVTFAPSLLNVIFGLLSDCVQPGCGVARLAPGASRISARMRWVVAGFVGAASCQLPFALGAVRALGPLYLFGVSGACFGTLSSASLEGVMVSRGRETAEALFPADAVAKSRLRACVQTLDYQIRGVGTLLGYGGSAVLLTRLPSHITIGAGVLFHLVSIMLAVTYARAHTLPSKRAADGAQAAQDGSAPCAASVGLEPALPRRPPLRAAEVRVAALAALAAFIYQLPPTVDDSFDAFALSETLGLAPATLSASATLSQAMAMVVAPALYARLALGAPASFGVGAAAVACANVVQLAFVRLATGGGLERGGAALTATFYAQSALSSLLEGLGFVPVVVLAALAAPAGAEATVFGFVFTAQTAGSLAAAAAAAMLTARMRVGMPGGSDADARSWEALPDFMLLCAALKLSALLPVLPLLRACTQLGARDGGVLDGGALDGGALDGGALDSGGTDAAEVPRDWRQPLSHPLLSPSAADGECSNGSQTVERVD